MLEIMNETQGSQEWVHNRISRYNASESASMLDLDSDMSRDELLRLKALGLEREYSDWTLKLFEEGHRVEKFAIEEFENIYGSPIIRRLVGYDRETNMGASLDGLIKFQSGEKIGVEVKLYNQKLASMISSDMVPDKIMAQIQSQMHVWNLSSVFLVVSDGTTENFRYIEIFPSEKWQDRIQEGWKKFEEDMKSVVEASKIIEQANLPVVRLDMLPVIDVQAAITITRSNVSGYMERVKKSIALVPRNPTTEEEFELVDLAIKWCKQNERDCETILRLSTRNEILDEVRAIAVELKDQRIYFERVKATERERVRAQQISNALKEINRHFDEVNSGFNDALADILPGIHINLNMPANSLAAAMHGKQIDAAQKAADKVVHDVKNEINASAEIILRNARYYVEQVHVDYRILFPDIGALILDPNLSALKIVIWQRICDYEADIKCKRIAEREQALLEKESQKADPHPPLPNKEEEAVENPDLDSIPPDSEESDEPEQMSAGGSVPRETIGQEPRKLDFRHASIFFEPIDTAPLDRRIILVYPENEAEYLLVFGSWRTRNGVSEWFPDLAERWHYRKAPIQAPIAWAEAPVFKGV